MTLKVIRRLQAFSRAIRRTFVQHFTRFQLTMCSRGSSALAELLVYTQFVFCHYVGFHHQLRRRQYRYETLHTIIHTCILTLYFLFVLTFCRIKVIIIPGD